jgi:hypothetical protein
VRHFHSALRQEEADKQKEEELEKEMEDQDEVGLNQKDQSLSQRE